MEGVTRPDAYAAHRVGSVYLADIDHPDGRIRVSTALVTLDHDGHEWQGLGQLASLSMPDDTTENTLRKIEVGVSGVEPQFVEGINTSVRGRELIIYRGVMGPNRTLEHVELIALAEMSHQSFSIGEDGKASITITGNAGIYNMRRKSSALVDPQNHAQFLEAQGIDPATDTGYDRVHVMADATIPWGPA